MIPLYSDSEDPRPLIYLDQNIIDALRKGVYRFEDSLFSERARAIYSDETLREVSRAEDGGGDATEFLDVLKNLDAYHLQVQLNERFEPTGNAIIQSHSPMEAYKNFALQRDVDYLIEANLLISRKIMGGLPELSIDDIGKRMLEAFERNFRPLDEAVKNFELFFPNARKENPLVFESLSKMTGITVDEYREILGQLIENLKNSIKLDESESAMSRYRDELKLGAKNLNNIKPPRVVEQVWQIISRDENIKNSGVTMGQFFGVDTPNPIYKERRNFVSEQVSSIYFHLNLAGYYPDKGLNQRRRFASSFSDMQHVSMATHCNILLSSDRDLIKKASAAYEFTGADTEAALVSVKSD